MEWTVRRLAAVDLYGTRGGRFRRRLILAEFLVACAVGLGTGATLLVAGGASRTAMGLVLGGIGLNYLPLCVHAMDLSRPGRLQAELEGADIARDLRRYSLAMLWLFLPFAVAARALREACAPG